MVKTRRIAFVGNLPYDCSREALQQFLSCAGEIQIRLPTNKDGKPKGFAFVECDSNEGFQKLLRLHHQMFKGRRLNVELTAGGGGNSQARRAKIKRSNAKMQKFRQKLFEHAVKTKRTEKDY